MMLPCGFTFEKIFFTFICYYWVHIRRSTKHQFDVADVQKTTKIELKKNKTGIFSLLRLLSATGARCIMGKIIPTRSPQL